TSGTGFVTSREADASSSHAEGVAVLFLAAALVATRRCLGGTSGKAFKSPPKVLKVVVADFEFFHFVDDRLEVREGTHGSQGRRHATSFVPRRGPVHFRWSSKGPPGRIVERPAVGL